jgi:hypothetical protein
VPTRCFRRNQMSQHHWPGEGDCEAPSGRKALGSPRVVMPKTRAPQQLASQHTVANMSDAERCGDELVKIDADQIY